MTVHYETVEQQGKLMGLRAAFLVKKQPDMDEILRRILCLPKDYEPKMIGEDTVYITEEVNYLKYEIRVPKDERSVAVSVFIENNNGDSEYTLSMILNMSYELTLGIENIFPIESRREDLPVDLFRQ